MPHQVQPSVADAILRRDNAAERLRRAEANLVYQQYKEPLPDASRQEERMRQANISVQSASFALDREEKALSFVLEWNAVKAGEVVKSHDPHHGPVWLMGCHCGHTVSFERHSGDLLTDAHEDCPACNSSKLHDALVEAAIRRGEGDQDTDIYRPLFG